MLSFVVGCGDEWVVSVRPVPGTLSCDRSVRSRDFSRPLGGVVTPSKLAEYLELSEQTLANWRSRKRGPAWVKIGGQVRYRDKDIEVFISENAVSSGR